MRRFLVGLVIASIAATAPVGALAGDKEIAKHILQKIDAEKKAGNLRGFDIGLKVEDGHVWLTGQVASQQQMDSLLQIASQTANLGTKQVHHNQLRVVQADRPVAETARKSTRFPNLLAVFTRDEQKEEVQQVESQTVVAPKEAAPQAAKPQLTSSRRTYRQNHADWQTNEAGLAKQPASRDGASKAGNVPNQISYPTLALPAARATRAEHAAPVPAPRHQVALAGGTKSFTPRQGVKSDTVEPAASPDVPATPSVKPSQADAQLTPLAPIPDSQANAIAAQLSAATGGQLSQEQTAALYQQYLARVQQVQAQYAHLASLNQTPVAFAPASAPNAMGAVPMAAPSYMPVNSNSAIHHDHPTMPPYAWPGYAAHPNYAAVTYPKQYAPSAWPYIGPFYPYPQVPLGWRKVQLEWDDGWWFLNFKNRHFR